DQVMLRLRLYRVSYGSFFFQAEDGIRDFHVTGVQTCALPIWRRRPAGRAPAACRRSAGPRGARRAPRRARAPARPRPPSRGSPRSEERRVGKEWSSRWAAEPQDKKNSGQGGGVLSGTEGESGR